MAARRLAISSLLCDDDPPNAVASESHIHHDFPPLSLQSTSDSLETRHSPFVTRSPDPVHPSVSNPSPPLPRPRTHSTSSFPGTLLNPVSPSMPSPLGGLEALVQAATEERRRLSGGALSPRRTQLFQTSPSHSPDATHRPFDLVPAHQLSPRLTYHSPPQAAGHISESHRTSVISPVEGYSDSEERPPKRKRSLGSRSAVERDNDEPSLFPLQTGNMSDRHSLLPSSLQVLMSPESAERGVMDERVGRAAHRSSGTWPESDLRRSTSAASQRRSPEIHKAEASRRSPVFHRVQIIDSPEVSSDFASPAPAESDRPTRIWSPEPRVHNAIPSLQLRDPFPPPSKIALEDASPFYRAPEPTLPVLSPPADTVVIEQSTSASAIEQELEEVAGIGCDSAMDMVPDSAIALEIDISSSSHTTKPQRQPKPTIVEQDVDEELLSLVGDPSSSRLQPSRPSDKHAKTKSSAHVFASASGSAHRPAAKGDPSPLAFPPATAHPSLPSRSVSTASVKPERESMPPPSFTPAARVSDIETDGKGAPRPEEQPPVPKKKSGSKAKQTQAKQAGQPKARAKPSGASKSKSKPTKDGLAVPTARGKKTTPLPTSSATTTRKSAAAARSRSASVMPVAGSVGPDGEPEKEKEVAQEEEDEDDDAEDKLYCICKTSYDDEKVMIACDRCDEWYHTACVKMPDLEVDLVDQFICPPCVDRNPELSLRTTWKRRCLYGLEHRNPKSVESCHKPARGAFSKYCSDECGVKYMRLRIDLWADKGGDKERLWDSVKGAQRREGTVVSAKLVKAVDGSFDIPPDNYTIPGIVKPEKTKKDRELERLQMQLDEVVKKRDAVKEAMDIVLWREKVTEMAVHRSEGVEECGWDQRLCFGDEEVAEFGASVLESYEGEQGEGEAMHVDEGEWWCQGKKKCDRHAGWQKLRLAEVQFEKEMKEQALLKLTTCERKIRTRMEDILDPHARISAPCNSTHTTPQKPVALSSADGQVKAKPAANTDSKKGKKKK